MKKLLLLTLLVGSFAACDKDDDNNVCYKSAHVNKNPEIPNSFYIESEYPYNCDTGEPLQDLYREQEKNPDLLWVRWGS